MSDFVSIHIDRRIPVHVFLYSLNFELNARNLWSFPHLKGNNYKNAQAQAYSYRCARIETRIGSLFLYLHQPTPSVPSWYSHGLPSFNEFALSLAWHVRNLRSDSFFSSLPQFSKPPCSKVTIRSMQPFLSPGIFSQLPMTFAHVISLFDPV